MYVRLMLGAGFEMLNKNRKEWASLKEFERIVEKPDGQSYKLVLGANNLTSVLETYLS